MIKAVIFKEWVKTRLTFFISLAVAIAMTAYAIMGMNRIVTLKGADHLWIVMLLKDQTFIDVLSYLPIFIGLAIGLSQMLPEMTQRRLKLTLHLPVSQNKMVATMLFTGIVELVGIFAVMMIMVAAYDSTILIPQLTNHVLLTMIPWMLCGLNVYLFTTAICLEGTYRRRVIIGLLAVGMLVAYFAQSVPEAYGCSMLIYLVLVIVCTFALTYNSVYRFKEGRQD